MTQRMKLKLPTGIALAAAVGSNANNLRTSCWVRSCKQLERAQLRQGERVVDIGCGTGASSIALAERLGPTGRCWALTFQRQCWRARPSGCRRVPRSKCGDEPNRPSEHNPPTAL